MSQTQLANQQENEIYIPIYSRGKQVDRLVAAFGSRPVRIPEGMQFTDSFGIHRAQTERDYRTPLSIEATVMTDSTNIVLLFAKGEVILNWDRKEDMLHVRHPSTGQAFDLHGKGAVPVGRWHHLEWIIAEDVMRVLVNGEERFSLNGNYRGLSGKIGVRTGWRANLSIGSLHVEEYHRTDDIADTGYRAVPHQSSFIGCVLGAMRYCNRYTEDMDLLGGIGYWFRSLMPNASGDGGEMDAAELLRLYGLEMRRWERSVRSEQEASSFVTEALTKGKAIFGCFGGVREYLSVTAVEGTKLRLAHCDGAVRLVETNEADKLYTVQPGTESTARMKAAAAFRFAAEHEQSGREVHESAWLDSIGRMETSSLRQQATEHARRRAMAAQYVRSCREAVGGKLAQQLEAAARSYDEAAEHWGQVAQLLASSALEPGEFVSKAFAAEADAANTLGAIAEVLYSMRRLEGLRYAGYSCISQHNTLQGVADYYGIQGTEAWIKGASGRPFVFAIHERVNVHDICLPIPDHHFVRLFANVGLEIAGVEGYGKDEAYERLLEAAWDGARTAIDAGWACFGRSIDQDRGEYSLIVGYDQDGYYSHGWHGPSHKAIPWNMYGLGQCTCLQCTTRRLDSRTEGPVKSVCLCDACQRVSRNGPALAPQHEGEVRLYWAKPSAPANDRTIIRDALQFAIEFATPDGPWAQPDMHTGLQAYDRLIRALEKGTIDGWYLGLYANGWGECRKLVLDFLHEGKRRLDSPQLANAFDAAIRESERLHGCFAKLYEMFPWMQPFGPIPDTERRYAGADLLRGARKIESAAIQAYRELLERMNQE